MEICIMDLMRRIRGQIKGEEFDYLILLHCLSDYKQPRDKITKLLKNGSIIRVKKGLYVFGEDYRHRGYSLEVLSNLIYGPSYVSFEYALACYGIIPEAVKRVTAACLKKNKHFKTLVGEFVYYPLPPQAFPLGITRQAIDENSHFLMASKEKALIDLIAQQKSFLSDKDLFLYLKESLRVDLDEVLKFNAQEIKEISAQYKNKNIDLLCKIFKV